ncbi:hypothetical protein [Bacillus sp. NPDC093026]|uniref:hypothetical protein n=1 Tax=Bacillus sp. NPDC093026 TaxID=3363948 RepID=UPI00381F234E
MYMFTQTAGWMMPVVSSLISHNRRSQSDIYDKGMLEVEGVCFKQLFFYVRMERVLFAVMTIADQQSVVVALQI